MAPLFALTTTTIGVIGLLIVVGGWIIYGIFNVVAGRREVGSEVELAANRKPYYDDETLEGPRLERVQLLGVIMLGIIVVALPLYWVFEPSRQAGAQEGWDNRFASWGSQLFAPTAEGGFNCAGCHGGMQAVGGEAPFTVTDPITQEVAGRQLEGTGAQHGAVQVRRERDPLHPQLRPSVLADVAVGPRRRRSDEHPADRQPDRLHQEHPDPARRMRRRRGRRSSLRFGQPAR